MGATTFFSYIEEADINKAFTEATTAAKNYYGRGGYTGTIAEKDSYVIVAAKPLTEDAAYAEAGELLDADDERIADKWGPAGAIPIKRGPRFRTTVGWMFFGWASE